ncbi:GH3 auxin-responsive promoter family protein [Salisaeta longa]|uniref:GH3 auxin-responsive promoter family protein n=1 Tax=Salisaeta longa TaxID=503170 RepID=UPI0003B4624A|nr:GH3 auxin-responsive promoter family protein [Salisaeta longa]
MKDFLRSLIRRLGPLRRVDRFLQHPVTTQERLLRRLLTTAADTEWGQRYDFRAIAQASDVVGAYQERVPLHTYDDLRDDAKRIRAGAPDVTWPGRIDKFAVSSGTVSEGKVIPVSDEIIACDRAFSMGTGFNYIAETLNWRLLLGKHLTLPGRIEEDPNYPGTMVGEISGLLAEAAPGYFRRLLQAVPNDVAFLPNWEQKLRAIAERTVDEDIRLLVMAPTWALVLFDVLLEVYNEQHADTAHTVADVWPNLQLFISGGVALRSYRTLLEAQIGTPIDFIETYGASEGFFSFQNTVDDPSMLLHLDNGLFYEFVPMDEKDDEEPTRHTIATVEPGVRYALYITSCSGLWSYDVGDVVRFTSTQPHKIQVAGRTSEMIDKYGEAVYGDEARAALRAACEATGAHMKDYHIAPQRTQEGTLPGLEWIIEFKQPPADGAAFAKQIDAYLQEVNRHYQIRREAQAFAPPEVTAVPEGTFYAWLKKTKDSVSGQTKVPRMSEERNIATGILEIPASTIDFDRQKVVD